MPLPPPLTETNEQLFLKYEYYVCVFVEKTLTVAGALSQSSSLRYQTGIGYVTC